MRISDWSSDVCSSDLPHGRGPARIPESGCVMLCRFENRLSGQALEMNGFVRRIAAHTAAELPAAFRQIDDAQKQGCWVALLLDYELGEWLEPAFSAHGPTGLRNGMPGAQTTATPQIGRESWRERGWQDG